MTRLSYVQIVMVINCIHYHGNAGDVIRWEQQVRFRHMPTRQYLVIAADRHVFLIPDPKDPRTVFRLHPVIKVCVRLSKYLFIVGFVSF